MTFPVFVHYGVGLWEPEIYSIPHQNVLLAIISAPAPCGSCAAPSHPEESESAVDVVRSVPLPPLVPKLTLPDRQGQRRLPGRSPRRQPALPLPQVPVLTRRDVVFGMCWIDPTGRIADGTVTKSLGWTPGTRIGFTIRNGLIVAAVDETGRRKLDDRSHLWLPVNIRRACRLYGRERVLLAALPDRQRLIIHPPATLDQLTAAVHATALGGDQ